MNPLLKRTMDKVDQTAMSAEAQQLTGWLLDDRKTMAMAITLLLMKMTESELLEEAAHAMAVAQRETGNVMPEHLPAHWEAMKKELAEAKASAEYWKKKYDKILPDAQQCGVNQMRINGLSLELTEEKKEHLADVQSLQRKLQSAVDDCDFVMKQRAELQAKLAEK